MLERIKIHTSQKMNWLRKKNQEFRNPRPHSVLLALATGGSYRGSSSGIPSKSSEYTMSYNLRVPALFGSCILSKNTFWYLLQLTKNGCAELPRGLKARADVAASWHLESHHYKHHFSMLVGKPPEFFDIASMLISPPSTPARNTLHAWNIPNRECILDVV